MIMSENKYVAVCSCGYISGLQPTTDGLAACAVGDDPAPVDVGRLAGQTQELTDGQRLRPVRLTVLQRATQSPSTAYKCDLVASQTSL